MGGIGSSPSFGGCFSFWSLLNYFGIDQIELVVIVVIDLVVILFLLRLSLIIAGKSVLLSRSGQK